MTVSSQTNNESYDGNGVTTVWDLPFRFFDNGDIFVYLLDPAAETTTLLALGTDYTLTGAGLPEQFGSSPGKITTTVPVANGKTLYVERVMEAEQLTDIVNQGRFFPEVHEDVFDRLTMLIQQGEARLRGAIRVAIGDPEPSRLPSAALRANLLMGFDSLGNPIPVAPTPDSSASLALMLANTSLVSQGAAMIGRGGQVVDNFAEARTLLKTTPSKDVYINGHTVPGDGGGGHFTFDEADNTSIDNNGTILVTGDGGRLKRVYTGSVLSIWFGAKGDRIADDTVAIRAAIDYCNSYTRAKPLVVFGSCWLTASAFTDRPVEGTNSVFRVTGEGIGGGFYVNSAITMFSSRLPFGVNPGPTYSQDPCTEYTQFEGVEFVASNPALAAYVFDAKYLRLSFVSCAFRNIKAIGSAQYLQTIKFLNCRMRGHTGQFLLATDLYNVIANFNEFEISGAAFAWTGVARCTNLDYNLYEGSTGPFVSGTGTATLSVSRNYFEHNASPDITLGNSGGASNGVSIDFNLFLLSPAQAADPAFYPVILGIGEGISVNGNVSSGNLANNNSVLPFGLNAGNNVVAAGRNAFSSNPYAVSGLTARAGGGQALATAVTRKTTIFTVTATANDSARLPAVSIMEKVPEITVVNRGAATLAVFPASGERFAGFGFNVATTIASGASLRFMRESGDSWIFL